MSSLTLNKNGEICRNWAPLVCRCGKNVTPLKNWRSLGIELADAVPSVGTGRPACNPCADAFDAWELANDC